MSLFSNVAGTRTGIIKYAQLNMAQSGSFVNHLSSFKQINQAVYKELYQLKLHVAWQKSSFLHIYTPYAQLYDVYIRSWNVKRLWDFTSFLHTLPNVNTKVLLNTEAISSFHSHSDKHCLIATHSCSISSRVITSHWCQYMKCQYPALHEEESLQVSTACSH